MKKTETLQQLAAASNTVRVETLNQQVETLRQSKLRSAEELAATLEPLAQAMAALTDETRTSLERISISSVEQGETFRARVEMAIQALDRAAVTAQRAAERMDQAGRGMELRHYLLTVATGLITGLLASAFLIWLAPSPHIQTTLDPQAVAELLRPQIAALKRSRDK